MINQDLERRIEAYRGNPQALMQRYQQSQQLIDLLALQRIKSEKEAAARQIQMQMGQQPTVAEQREAEVAQRPRVPGRAVHRVLQWLQCIGELPQVDQRRAHRRGHGLAGDELSSAQMRPGTDDWRPEVADDITAIALMFPAGVVEPRLALGHIQHPVHIHHVPVIPRHAIQLAAGTQAVFVAPVHERFQEAFLEEFGQRHAPIVADRFQHGGQFTVGPGAA